MSNGDRQRKQAWIERVLGIAPVTAAPARAARVTPAVAFTQSRLIWDATRKQVQADLRRLEEAVLRETADEPDAQVIANNSRLVYTVLDALDERLIDKLDEALNAPEGDGRRRLQAEARDIVDEYRDFMAADELLHDIDDNGFIDLGIRETVSAQLDAISANLKTLGA